MTLTQLGTALLLAITAAVIGCGGVEGDHHDETPTLEQSANDQSLDETEDALRPRSPSTAVSCQISSFSITLTSGETCEMNGCSTGICPGGTVPTCSYGSCSKNKRGFIVTVNAMCTCI
jgi:hypothetical protein